MNDPIKELLEYLRSQEIATTSTPFDLWADAVEYLQKDLDIYREDILKLAEKVNAYERILNKGITVNVYGAGEIESGKDVQARLDKSIQDRVETDKESAEETVTYPVVRELKDDELIGNHETTLTVNGKQFAISLEAVNYKAEDKAEQQKDIDS